MLYRQIAGADSGHQGQEMGTLEQGLDGVDDAAIP